ncbi:MAG: hypothetical protein M3519_07485 [Actinomycetota bacterium]|nr:hypothetical protein [Actinomycetota bacterium]
MPAEQVPAESMTVRVHPPQVRGGRVRFSWEQDRNQTLQRRNRWFVHYHGVPVARMDRRLLYDVLLSLQLPLWAAQADAVRVVLPEPVGRVSLDFWRAYHSADHVQFEGRVDDTRHYPARRPAAYHRVGRRAPRRPLAITFGGGKDSTLAQQALLESRPASEVLLLHVVQLFSTGSGWRRRATVRSLRTVVWPNWRGNRNPVQLVSTDFMAVLRRDRTGPRPHVNLYAAAMLPALVHHGVHQLVFSRTALGYRLLPRRDGSRLFSNPAGRPERLRMLGAYYADVLGWGLHCESSHFAVGEYVSYASVHRHYPRSFDRMVMCTQTLASQRFCHSCPKCLEFALMGLSLGHVAPDLDYDLLLRHPRVDRIARHARSLEGRTLAHGAGPYYRYLGTATHFATWCHALHLLDPDQPGLSIGPEARANLRALKQAWGQVPFPVVEPGEGPERDHLLLVGDRPAQFDFEAVMPTPRLDDWAARWRVPGGRAPG